MLFGARGAPLKAMMAELRRLYVRIGCTVAWMFALMVVSREAKIAACVARSRSKLGFSRLGQGALNLRVCVRARVKRP